MPDGKQADASMITWEGPDLQSPQPNLHGLFSATTSDIEALEKKVDLLTEKVDALHRKLDLIFGNHILLKGKLIDINEVVNG